MCLLVKQSILYLIIFTLASTACSRTPIKPTPVNEIELCQQHYSPDTPFYNHTSEQYATQSKFFPINSSNDALTWRLSLIENARSTLNLQYYIWQNDEIGKLLAIKLLAAADRNVEVKLIIDDLDTLGKDSILSLLSAHPNITVKVFNPPESRETNLVKKHFSLLGDISRLNHRMHNKLFLVDNTIAILGSRNIGNEYFAMGYPFDYRDFELAIKGPLIDELRESFALFWNSPWTYSLENETSISNNPKLSHIKIELIQETNSTEEKIKKSINEFPDWHIELTHSKLKFINGNARAVYDCPPDTRSTIPVESLYTIHALLERAQSEILIVSPYVIPNEGFKRKLLNLSNNDVNIKILTNSLVTSDQELAGAAYTNHRTELISGGIKIFELKPDPAIWPLHHSELSNAEWLSLHAKIVIVDNKWVYVGSFNMDSRSAFINTELGVLVESPELAHKVIQLFNADFSTESSWQVVLDYKHGTSGKKVLWWKSEETKTDIEPARSDLQRIKKSVYRLLPIEHQL